MTNTELIFVIVWVLVGAGFATIGVAIYGVFMDRRRVHNMVQDTMSDLRDWAGWETEDKEIEAEEEVELEDEFRGSSQYSVHFALMNRTLTVRNICDRTLLSDSYVRRILEELMEDGKIEQVSFVRPHTYTAKQ